MGGKVVHLRASNSSLEIGINPREKMRPTLLTEEVGQVDVCAVCIIVPWKVSRVERTEAEGCCCAYTQRQSGSSHPGHHLLG